MSENIFNEKNISKLLWAAVIAKVLVLGYKNLDKFFKICDLTDYVDVVDDKNDDLREQNDNLKRENARLVKEIAELKEYIHTNDSSQPLYWLDRNSKF